jgi:hypothetical protein
MAANESSAAQSLRTISTANTTYSSVYGIGFALELSKLGPGAAVDSDSADLIDSSIAVAPQTKSGYNFTTYANDGHAGTQADPVVEYTLVATPSSPQMTGAATFCVDGTSVIRKDPAGGTAADDPGNHCDPGDGSVFPPL